MKSNSDISLVNAPEEVAVANLVKSTKLEASGDGKSTLGTLLDGSELT
ncbi:hypothetical protein [Ekhidna sp.]